METEDEDEHADDERVMRGDFLRAFLGFSGFVLLTQLAFSFYGFLLLFHPSFGTSCAAVFELRDNPLYCFQAPITFLSHVKNKFTEISFYFGRQIAGSMDHPRAIES